MSGSPISLRDETGVERFRGTQSPGGGSQPYAVRTIRVPLTFDTPGILTGIPAWEPEVGDLLLSDSGFSIPTTAWDAQTGQATINVYPRGQAYANFSILQGAIDGTNFDGILPGGGLFEWAASFDSNGNGLLHTGKPAISDGTPFDVIVDDGAGGDPGSSQGEGELVLFVVTAP